MGNCGVEYRDAVVEEDICTIRRLVDSSGFFSQEEVELAVELLRERLEKGRNSGYEFLFAERDGLALAYTCFGRIPCTVKSFDLYWIAVADNVRGQGLGHTLLRKTEEAIVAMGGRRIYAETSSRAQYLPTHVFYRSCGYHEEAFLEDFYAPLDGKLVYCKIFPG